MPLQKLLNCFLMLPPIFFQNDDVLSARIVHYGIDKHELFAFLTYSRKTYQLDHSFLFLFVSGMIEGRDYQLVKERICIRRVLKR